MNELLPANLRNILPRIDEQQNTADPIVYAKFFFPAGAWTWLVSEGQPEDADYLFFGYVIGFEAEWGYFTLRELESVKVNGIVIERDLYFEPARFNKCLQDLEALGLKTSGGQPSTLPAQRI